jgi:DNA-binding response OmpR family regulator
MNAVTHPRARPRVLIAEDEQGTLALMAETLADEGFDVVRARDGAEALRSARETPPDIALLDVMMPGLDGREVCRRLGADPALNHVPIVLFSGADERDVDWRACGADAFLRKPFRLTELPEVVRRQLAAHAGATPRARRLSDDEVKALAEEIRRAVRSPRLIDRRDDVLAPTRELSPEDEARVEAALLALLEASRENAQGKENDGKRATDSAGRDDDPT